MPVWHFSAIDGAGKTVNGAMEADDEAAVVARLRKDGALPIRISAARRGLAGALKVLGAGSFGGIKGLRRSVVADISRELATMLSAGQDLDRALRFIVETAPNRMVGQQIGGLRDEIRDGSSLAAALARRPESFSRLYAGLIRAGEAGGTLAETLERLADLMERERNLAATVQSALIYPALLTVAAIGAVVLLLTQVLPQFVPLFQENGATLPASTQFLIDAGAFVSQYGAAMLAAQLALFLIARAALRDPRARLAFDRLKLDLPILGGLTREMMAARLARTLGTLLSNRVSLIQALAIVRDVVANEAGGCAIDAAAASAAGGSGFAGALGGAGIFPPRLIHLLRLGEETAQLGPMALRAAAIHEEKVHLTTQRLMALLTPVITIAMGAVIAGIVSSLLLAMLSLNDLAR